MNPILPFLIEYVHVYKYIAIFIITFLGAFALPLPSGSLLLAASAYATATGRLDLAWVLGVGFLGNVLGDNTGYWLVRLYGFRVLEKFHLEKFFSPERLEAARQKLHEHPVMTIYSTRFLTAIAPAINVASGLSNLDYKRYLTFEVLGEMTEVVFFCGLGWLFGSNWEYVSRLSGWLLAIVFLSMLGSVFIWKKVLLKR